jgi:hypothetical protein
MVLDGLITVLGARVDPVLAFSGGRIFSERCLARFFQGSGYGLGYGFDQGFVRVLAGFCQGFGRVDGLTGELDFSGFRLSKINILLTL